jgi:hypothetical protein
LAALEPGMVDADTILTARAAELETVDHAIIGEVVGVAQAAGDLRKALDALDGLLDDRQFEKAAASGYQDIASAFIFLQRTLGGECPIFCVTVIWSMLPERSKDDDDFQGTTGRAFEGLRAA